MSQEQRSAFRIQMPDGQKGATLRVEGRNFDVQLLDASATGVALACPLQCAIEIDQCCELHTTSAGGVIRIVRKEVFPDGILLGAVRTGDLANKSRGLLGQAADLTLLPVQFLSNCSLTTRIGLIALSVAAAFVAVVGVLHWPFNGDSAASQILVPTTAAVEQTPSESEVQEALRQLEVTLPPLTAGASESDRRAARIFEQQRQLLAPEVSRRLRLTPTQESRIQRALAPAEEAANDQQSPHFWEAIRRSESQILRILTPSQVKAWRRQTGA
jgi:hypothetical protein